MIFFYGAKWSTILSEPAAGIACSSCGQEDSIVVNVVSRYAHFFWIPVFPFSKKLVTVCRHCQKADSESRMPPAARAALMPYKAKAKFPVWEFAGLIIVGAAILVPLIAGGITALLSHR